MDPAVAALDFTEAGAIIASMVVSYLAASEAQALPLAAPPSNPKEAEHADTQDQRKK